MKQAKEKAPQAAATAQSAKNKTQYQSTADQAVCQAPEIPGCCFVGYICNEHTGYRTVPLYEPKAPTDGRPSINTLEGWNLHRWESAERKLLMETGRQPTDAEIQAELDRQTDEAKRLIAQWEAGVTIQNANRRQFSISE